MRPSRERIINSPEPRSSVVIPFPVPNSDFGLVAALRASHPDAIQVLCDRYSGEMLAIATRVLGPDAQIPKVVIDTIRIAIGRIDDSFEPREFRRWLLAHLMTELRRRLRTRRRWGWLALGTRHSWADGVGCSERLHATYSIIDRMDEMQRLVFCLIVIHSLEVSETATLLGLPPDGVELLLDRACTFFLRHIPRHQRGLTHRKFYYLSLGAEIVQEQDLVIEGWWISEEDIVHQPAQPRSSIGRLLAVLVVLTCTAALLLARIDRVGSKASYSSRSNGLGSTRLGMSQNPLSLSRQIGITGRTTAWSPSEHTIRVE